MTTTKARPIHIADIFYGSTYCGRVINRSMGVHRVYQPREPGAPDAHDRLIPTCKGCLSEVKRRAKEAAQKAEDHAGVQTLVTKK